MRVPIATGVLLFTFWMVATGLLIFSLLLAVDTLLVGIGQESMLTSSHVEWLGWALFMLALILFGLYMLIRCRNCGSRLLTCSSRKQKEEANGITHWWEIPRVLFGNKTIVCCRCNKDQKE